MGSRVVFELYQWGQVESGNFASNDIFDLFFNDIFVNVRNYESSIIN